MIEESRRRRSKSTMRPAAFLIAALTATGLSAGCSTHVEPVLGIDHPFTIYGFFNPLSDTQAVRVFPIEGELERTRPRPIDAQVVSIEVPGDAPRVWADSLVLYSSPITPDAYGHVFYDLFRPEHEHTYRLDVSRSDGATSSVEVTVPPVSTPDVLMPIDEPGRVVLPVLWHDAPQLIDVEVIYQLDVYRYVVKYPYPALRAVPGGVQVDVQFSRDAREFLSNPPVLFSGVATLSQIEMRVMVANAEWVPPDGFFNAEFLVEPGTFSNVENGFGFFGAGYPSSVSWLPDDALIRKVGFAPPDHEDDGS